MKSISWKVLEYVFVKSTNDYISIVKSLLESGKAVAYEIIHLSDGITWQLFIASEKGSLFMVKLLLKYPTKEGINNSKNKGTICLWITACNRHIDIVH